MSVLKATMPDGYLTFDAACATAAKALFGWNWRPLSPPQLKDISISAVVLSRLGLATNPLISPLVSSDIRRLIAKGQRANDQTRLLKAELHRQIVAGELSTWLWRRDRLTKINNVVWSEGQFGDTAWRLVAGDDDDFSEILVQAREFDRALTSLLRQKSKYRPARSRKGVGGRPPLWPKAYLLETYLADVKQRGPAKNREQQIARVQERTQCDRGDEPSRGTLQRFLANRVKTRS